MSTPHINYRFLVRSACDDFPNKGRFLDFGCGKGDIVMLALEHGWDAYGVEYFSSGSGPNIKEVLEKRGLLGNRVMEYDGKVLPFENNTFDTVISNQVFEHVPDLHSALREVSRVLKPKGILYFSFPYQNMWREPHSNVFFVHWMTPGSRVRRIWLRLNRWHGRVRLTKNRPGKEWVDFFDTWLHENTFYLDVREIKHAFDESGFEIHLNEAEYLNFRLANGNVNTVNSPQYGVFRPIINWLVRCYAGLYGVARKR